MTVIKYKNRGRSKHDSRLLKKLNFKLHYNFININKRQKILKKKNLIS